MNTEIVLSTISALFVAFRDIERWEEPLMISEDRSYAKMGWGNVQQIPEPTIIIDNTWLTDSNYTIDYNNGTVSFNTPLQSGVDARATYTMSLFNYDFPSQFFDYVIQNINIKKPQSDWSFQTAPDRYLATAILGIYVKMLEAMIIKISMFRWRRLFQNPDGLEVQMRANLEAARQEYDTLLNTTKRRGDATPCAVSSWYVGRNVLFQFDEVNFQAFVVSR